MLAGQGVSAFAIVRKLGTIAVCVRHGLRPADSPAGGAGVGGGGGFGLHGVRTLRAARGESERAQPAQAWAPIASSADRVLGRGEAGAARVAAQREHGVGPGRARSWMRPWRTCPWAIGSMRCVLIRVSYDAFAHGDDPARLAPAVGLIAELEVGMAFIDLRDGIECTTQEIIDFAAPRIANFKVPRYVTLRDRVSDDRQRQGPPSLSCASRPSRSSGSSRTTR